MPVIRSRLNLARAYLAVVGVAAVLCVAEASAQLGTAGNFGVLAGTTVTNTGATVVIGDVGVSPGSAVVGFPPGIVVPPGTIHAGDSVAAQAQSALTAAYNDLQGLPSQIDLTGQNLGGLTLSPAVYSFATSAQLTGVLTLNGLGNPNAIFVFQIGSTLTAASNATILTTNGASPYNVFWAVGSSATLGTNAAFAGNIVALTSITLNTGASLTGRALAQNGAVTLDDNVVTAFPPCSAIVLTPATLANGTVGVPFSEPLVGSGGTVPYTFDMTTGALPTGLTLSSAGVLTGTPTAPGTFTFAIRATDINGCVGSLAYTMVVTAAVPTLPQTFTLLLALALVTYGSLRLWKARVPSR